MDETPRQKTNVDRRGFMRLSAGGLAAMVSGTAIAREAPDAAIKAIAFDGFPVFDPRPIAALAEKHFPGRGSAVMDAWRTRQFEYQWLRALGGQYVDFMVATRDSLLFAAKHLKIELASAVRDELLDAWMRLQPWPDAAAGLQALHGRGLRLAFLSNMSAPMLQGGLRAARIDGLFEAVISTDRIRSFKPDPRAYQLGVDVLRLRKEEILFVAFAGWDVAGAKWFGYPTFWLNRQNSEPEVLGAEADGAGAGFAELDRFLKQAGTV